MTPGIKARFLGSPRLTAGLEFHEQVDVAAGQSMPGRGPGVPMEVRSSGSSDLRALVMFVADATKPFSSPATLP